MVCCQAGDLLIFGYSFREELAEKRYSWYCLLGDCLSTGRGKFPFLNSIGCARRKSSRAFETAPCGQHCLQVSMRGWLT